jgi:hypothetical protein
LFPGDVGFELRGEPFSALFLSSSPLKIPNTFPKKPFFFSG